MNEDPLLKLSFLKNQGEVVMPYLELVKYLNTKLHFPPIEAFILLICFHFLDNKGFLTIPINEIQAATCVPKRTFYRFISKIKFLGVQKQGRKYNFDYFINQIATIRNSDGI